MSDQQEPAGFFSAITPAVVATLIVAVLSVSGALLVAIYNARAQRALEREQFESNLILKAVGIEDKKLRNDNFRFLIEGGLIRPQSEKIGHLLQDTSLHIHFPVDKPAPQELESASASLARIRYNEYTLAISAFSGIVLDAATAQPLKGVTVALKTNRSRPRAEEKVVTGNDGKFILHYPPRPFFLNYSCSGYFDEKTNYEYQHFKGPLIVRLKSFRPSPY